MLVFCRLVRRRGLNFNTVKIKFALGKFPENVLEMHVGRYHCSTLIPFLEVN